MQHTNKNRFLCMKLSALFLLSSVGLAHATGTYAQEARISLDAKNETVQEVLKEIEEESGFSFFYNIFFVSNYRSCRLFSRSIVCRYERKLSVTC